MEIANNMEIGIDSGSNKGREKQPIIARCFFAMHFTLTFVHVFQLIFHNKCLTMHKFIAIQLEINVNYVNIYYSFLKNSTK